MMRNIILAWTVFLVIFLCGCQPKEKHELTLNLNIGDKYSYNQITTQHFFQRVMGISHEIEHEFLITYSLLVEDVFNDKYMIKFKYDELSMDVKSREVNISVGTGDKYDPSDTLSLVLKAFTQKPLTISISKHGEINLVSRMDEYLELVMDDLDFELAEDEFEAIEALDQFIGESGFSDILNQLVSYFPHKPVSTKDIWISEYVQRSLGLSGLWKNRWRLIDIDEKNAIIEGKSIYEIVQDAKEQEYVASLKFADMGIEVDMDGIQEINHKVDRKTGLITNGVINSIIGGFFKTGEETSIMDLYVKIEINSEINRID